MNESAGPIEGVAVQANSDFLSGGGSMGALMRAKDWAGTPLGPFDAWPQSLRTSVSTCLNCAFPILVWWGPELVMLYNDEYRPILGSKKHPSALGAPGHEVWPEIWDVIGPMLDKAMTGEPARARDLLLVMDRNGYLEETYFSFSYSPIHDESGGIGGVFCPVIETTATVVGERRLETLTQLSAAAAEQAKSVAEIFKHCLSVLQANPADVPFAILYDLANGQPQLAGSFGVGSSLQAETWPLAQVMGSETVLIDDLFFLPDPPLSLHGEQVRGAVVLPIPRRGQGAVTAALVLGLNPRRAFDATYRVFVDRLAAAVATAAANARAFEIERERAETLAEIDRVKTTFFSNVSHEFRTPLTLMLGPIEDILNDSAEPLLPAQRSRLEVAQRNSLRLLKLVNTLLDFSRIEAGRAQASYVPTDLASVTAELASNFRSAIERAGIAYVVDCPPLPQPVYLDRDMWEKIVLNLLSNAFKFTFEGEIAVRVSARSGSAVLTVSDTGVGVPTEELPRLFERFHRIEGQRGRTHEGSGIGLALVQELVNLHGGEIRAQSRPGAGTTFSVSIPFGTGHLSPERIGGQSELTSTSVRPQAYVEEAIRWLTGASDEVPSAEGGEPHVNAAREPGRILVADDNADMRAYIQRLLEQRWEIEAVPDGKAALEAARRGRPDLILADVMMPEMDGFGLLEAIRSDPALRDIPVVMLSARAGEEASSEGLAAGADDYLVKPFTARELIARVRGTLSLGRLRLAAVRDAADREKRKSFLLNLSDTLRNSSDARAVMAEAAQLVAQHLQVERAGYGEIDPAQEYLTIEKDWIAPGMPSLAGSHHLASFGPELMEEYRTGRTVKVGNALSDPRVVGDDRGGAIARKFAAINTCAGIGVPLVKEGRWVAVFFVHQSEPREWMDEEISLVEEVAERTWAVVERARAEARQQVLVNELNHRVKNTLATVQSMTSQTLRSSGVDPAVRARIDARLITLARGHDILTAANWEGAEMRRVAAAALAPFRGEGNRVKVEGPPVHLGPKAALSLTMALHELATNATKYGALSADQGRVEVTWAIDDVENPRFRFLWKETGGPAVRPPRSTGFGSKLLERSLAAELHGDVRLDYAPEGFQCSIDVPLANVWAVEE